MIEEIFATLPTTYKPGVIEKPLSYYFSLGEYKKTVELTGDSCLVSDGRTIENADCVCKTSPEFFLKIWQDGYRPGVADFLAGTIKSNDPPALQLFLQCFDK